MGDEALQGHPITAWAAVNSLGIRTEEVVAALRSGRPCFSPAPPGTLFESVCGAVEQDLPPLRDELAEFDSRNNRFVQQALGEMTEAIEGAVARWTPERVGICLGTSTAATDEIERAYEVHAETGSIPQGFDVLRHASSEGLLHVVRRLAGIRGPSTVVSNACASSGKAFASARRWLNAGVVDAVLVGGADSLCQLTLRGFRSLGLLSATPSRPFSVERCGINIGEGAAFALIEREGRGPRLLGTGESSDAHHMTSPDPEGRGAATAMERALSEAGVSPSAVDYINAHGTGTRSNDAIEARAIRTVLGESASPIVVSTKGYMGHALGAAGACEAVFVLESLCGGWTPASAGAEPLDPELEVEISTVPRDLELRVAISNSFAFGGSNVCLVFGAPA